MSGLHVTMYFALAVFVLGTGYKLLKIARMPLHLRWDLYPIPHEKGKGHYGGSYFEEVDWWTKPANTTLVGELKEMAREILFIQSMYHHNRPLWLFSFPFHFGSYLLIGLIALLVIGGLVVSSGGAVSPDAGTPGALLYYAALALGITGSLLMTFGAIGLLISRATKRELRMTSVWIDYFNLLLLAAIGVTSIASWLGPDTGFHFTRAFVGSLVTFSPTPALPGIVTVHLALSALFFFWLPMTHMTHFVGKYFTYHKVRWEDHPNIRGSKIEAAVTKALGYEITWSAPHIKGGLTWVEAAGGTGKEERKK